MNPLNIVLKNLIEYAASAIATFIATGFIIYQGCVINFLKPYLTLELSIKMFLIFLFAAIFLSALLLDLKRKQKLKTFFHLPWDKHLNPYCPKCEKVLRPHYDVVENKIQSFFAIQCQDCETYYDLIDHKDTIHTLAQARQKIRNLSIFKPRYF